MKNYYQILEVPHFAPFEAIQKAFNRLYSELFSVDNPLSNISRIKEIKEAFDFLGDPEKRTDYDSQLQLFLDELEKLFNKAVENLAANNFESAICDLKECIRIDPQEPDFYETLGLAYQLSGKLDEAIKMFQQGLRINDKNKKPLFYWYLGDIFKSSGDTDKAETYFLDAAEGFKEILKIDPQNKDALEMLADTFSKIKWYEESIEIYQKLLEKFPYNSEYHRSLGGVFYELDMLDEAEEHLKESMRTMPEDSSTLLFLGLVYFKRRLLSLAVENLIESLRLKPNQKEVENLIEKIIGIQEEIGQTVEELIQNPFPDAFVEGIVKWFNTETGVGVLSCPEFPDVLLHYSALTAEDQNTLKKGDPVKFGVVKDKTGYIAVQVERINSSDDSDIHTGTILKFDPQRRIGVISNELGQEVLFSFSALTEKLEKDLIVGAPVLFQVKTSPGINDKAIERAFNIRPRQKPRKKKDAPKPPQPS